MRIQLTSLMALALFTASVTAGGLRPRGLSNADSNTEKVPAEEIDPELLVILEQRNIGEQEDSEDGRDLRHNCSNSYKCPSNSYHKPNRQCYDSFDDCSCYSGYYKQGYKCVKKDDNKCKNDYHCPSNSYRKPNRQCYDSFDDCSCYSGYYKQGYKCVKKGSNKCKNDYHCPAYSYRKPNRQCYDSFDDCKYFLIGPECVIDVNLFDPHPCTPCIPTGQCYSGYTKDNNYKRCVKDNKPTCYNNYKCPAYSYRKPNRKCYDTFDDCQCYNGYYKYGNRCVRGYYGKLETQDEESSGDGLGPKSLTEVDYESYDEEDGDLDGEDEMEGMEEDMEFELDELSP